MNRVFITARLGEDPSSSMSSNNKTTIVRFSLAIETPGKEAPVWINAVAFNELGEYMVKNAKKGTEIFLEGSISAYTKTTEGGKKFTNHNIVANKIELISGNIEKERESIETGGGII